MASEIIQLRDRYSKCYSVDGKIIQEIETFPIHYQDEDGNWKEINRNIKNLRQWEFTSGSINHIFSSYFGDFTDETNRHLFGIQYKKDGIAHWINFKIVDGSNKFQKIEKDKIVFLDCFENVDVEYIVSDNYLKENIILKQKTERTHFDFTIKSNGLELIQEDDYFYVRKDDVNIWFIDKPYMYDAKGNISYGVKYELIKDKNSDFDIFSVSITDTKFLESATYPLVIDPTLVVEDGNQDVIYRDIGESRPGTWSYNTSPDIWLRLYNYAASEGALYFNAIERFKDDNLYYVNKAILSMYCYQGGPNFGVANLTEKLTSSSNPVRENTLYINKAVATNTWVDIDFTEQINERKSEFYGFYFTPSYNVNAEIHFRSPFYSNASLRPKLKIEYLIKPTLGFHSGDPSVDGFFSDNNGVNFRYLNFGSLIAGQTSPSQRVYVRNLTAFNVNDLKISVDSLQFAPGMKVELSNTNSPFVGEESIVLNGTLLPNEDRSFYVRVSSSDETTSGSNFNIYAKANPAF